MSRERSVSFGGQRKRPEFTVWGPMSARVPDDNEETDADDSRESLENAGLGGKLRRFDNMSDLNTLLTHRPDKADLIAKNILKPDNVSPLLAAKQEELRKKKLEATLNVRLATRSNMEDLKGHNILKSIGDLGPSAAEKQAEERKRSVEEALNLKLSHRMPLEEAERKCRIAYI